MKKYPNLRVIVPDKPGKETTQDTFETLSVSDGVVNVYRAFQVAEEMSKK